MELTTNSKNIPTTTSAVTNPIMKLYISSSLFCCRSAVQEQVVQEQVRQPVTRAYALEIEDEDTPGSENVPCSPNVGSRSKRTHATMDKYIRFINFTVIEFCRAITTPIIIYSFYIIINRTTNGIC